MTTYKEIRGTNIEVLESDPSNPIEGQVWYNSTSNVLKGQAVTTSGSWATGGSLNTGVEKSGGAGIQTSALSFGGKLPPTTAGAESYNGTNWTEINSLNQARNAMGGAGADNTSAVAFGGEHPSGGNQDKTESWNGSNWTEVNDLNEARNSLAGCGTATAALAFGGSAGPLSPSNRASTESWNGTNWTTVNNMNSGRYNLAGGGTNTSAMAFGGYDTSQRAYSELWNGTNWTETNDLNQARYSLAGCGTSNTSALAFGGQPGLGATSALTELWNGSNWTEDGDLNNARVSLTGAGTATLGLVFGGEGPPPARPFTEEWTGAGSGQTRTFTDS